MQFHVRSPLLYPPLLVLQHAINQLKSILPVLYSSASVNRYFVVLLKFEDFTKHKKNWILQNLQKVISRIFKTVQSKVNVQISENRGGGEGTFSKILVRLRAKSKILKTWGSQNIRRWGC